MASTKIELVVHPLCPYAQRALYTASFKRLPVEIVHVSVAHPQDWFLELNPLGEVPAVKVTKDGQLFKLTESLNISEYFDSFEGPSLYPRLESGHVDPLAKAQIDLFIKLKLGRFISAFYAIFFNKNPSEEERKEIENAFLEISSHVENGSYILHKVLGKNELTFADVMVLSYIERLSVLKDTLPEYVKALNLENLWKWYENVGGQDWAQEHKVPPHQLRNLFKLVEEGGYQGLDLPLSIYD